MGRRGNLKRSICGSFFAGTIPNKIGRCVAGIVLVLLFWQDKEVESQEQNVSILVRLFRAAAASGAPILYFGELAFVVALVILCIWFANREPESGFRVRESDLKKPGRRSDAPKKLTSDSLAEAKLKPKAKPLQLAGISLQGEPHEILGVRADATEAQIQKAYRELMKRYHPDIVGRPGSREWEDAQKIAEAINRAKSDLLASRGKKST